MRLFVAVWPSEEVVELLGALPRPEGVRWTGPPQWHVTLRFLGEVPDGAVDSLAAALPGGPAVPVTMGPATLRLRPSVLVVPVEGLEGLAGAVRAATAPLVPDTERRPFRGHLTLARGRGRSGVVPPSLAGAPLSAAWTVRRVSLVRSRLGGSGARYEEVAGVDLAGDP